MTCACFNSRCAERLTYPDCKTSLAFARHLPIYYSNIVQLFRISKPLMRSPPIHRGDFFSRIFIFGFASTFVDFPPRAPNFLFLVAVRREILLLFCNSLLRFRTGFTGHFVCTIFLGSAAATVPRHQIHGRRFQRQSTHARRKHHHRQPVLRRERYLPEGYFVPALSRKSRHPMQYDANESGRPLRTRYYINECLLAIQVTVFHSCSSLQINFANTSIELSKQNIYRFTRILFPPKIEVGFKKFKKFKTLKKLLRNFD